MNNFKPSFRVITLALISIVIIWSVRWLLLPYPDLVDSTEGRYASVGKVMFDSGEMITPMITRHGKIEPYLGKPPLYFWMCDLAYTVLGATTAAARTPSYISAIGTVMVTFAGIFYMFSLEVALATILILSSAAIFFFLSGVCMLDMTVTFAVTAACFGFYHSPRWSLWGYLAFLGLALGVLTKGPIALVLACAVIVPWVAAQWYLEKKAPLQLSAMPWLSGAVLFFLLTIPWYILQEIKNDGFLYYFLVQENFLRYLSSEYGDRYGTGHQQPRGASWVMLIGLAAPWAIIILTSFIWRIHRSSLSGAYTILRSNPPLLYVTLMAIACPAFFTFAKQLTATYILPALPGCAALTAALLLSADPSLERIRTTGKNILDKTPIIVLGMACIASLVSIFFRNSWLLWLATVISLGVIGMLSVTFRDKLFGQIIQSMLGKIVTTSLVSLLLYATIIVDFSNFQSLTRSTARLFALIREKVPTETVVVVGFPYEFPFSTTFYSHDGQLPAVTPLRVEKEKIITSRLPYMAVNIERREEFEKLLVAAVKIGEIGDWSLYRTGSLSTE